MWSQEEEEKYLKSPYKKYKAEELAHDATANIDVDAVETDRNPKHPRVTTCNLEMDEATDTRVWCEDD